MNTPPSDSTLPASTSAIERPPLRVRLARGAAAALVALTTLLFLLLLLLGLVLSSPGSDFVGQHAWAKIVVGVLAVAAALMPFVLLRRWKKQGRLTGRVLGPLGVACAGALAWLAWDEATVRHPLTVEEHSPAFPGAEKSYAVLMRYSKRTPSAEATAFTQLKLRVPVVESSPREPEKWIAFITKRRADLEADWATLAPQRQWLAELNTFDRIADLGPARLDANIPTFAVWRTLSQRTCAQATLQALDGRGDEAIATLAPVLAAARRLQASSRTLVRSMVALVVERLCLETSLIVFERGRVSPTGRQQLEAALATGLTDDALLARRLILVEYAQILPLVQSMPLGDIAYADQEKGPILVQAPLNLIGRLFFNPTATANLFGDHFHRIATHAAERRLDRFAAEMDAFMERLHPAVNVKNVGGRLILSMALPAYQKVLDSFWATADTRAKVAALVRAG